MGIIRNDDGEFFDTDEQAMRTFDIEGEGDVGEIIQTGNGQYVDVTQQATRMLSVNGGGGGGGIPFAPSQSQSVRFDMDFDATEIARAASPKDFEVRFAAPVPLFGGGVVDPLFGIDGDGYPLVPVGGWVVANLYIGLLSVQDPGPVVTI